MTTRLLPTLACACLLVLAPSVGPAVAQIGALDHSPAEIVKKYFSLDQRGARLDSLSFEALAPFTDWHDEPVWGHVVIIRAVTVAEHYKQWNVIDRLEVVIPVRFQVIGSVYFETAGFVPAPGEEEILVRVKSVKNRWRIIEPVVPPHVGHKRMLNIVREAEIKEQDPIKRGRLAALHEELRKVK